MFLLERRSGVKGLWFGSHWFLPFVSLKCIDDHLHVFVDCEFWSGIWKWFFQNIIWDPEGRAWSIGAIFGFGMGGYTKGVARKAWAVMKDFALSILTAISKASGREDDQETAKHILFYSSVISFGMVNFGAWRPRNPLGASSRTYTYSSSLTSPSEIPRIPETIWTSSSESRSSSQRANSEAGFHGLLGPSPPLASVNFGTDATCKVSFRSSNLEKTY